LYDGYANYGWLKSDNQNDMNWTIDSLEPGDAKEFKYSVKINRINSLNEVIIKNKAIVNVSNLALIQNLMKHRIQLEKQILILI